MVSDGDSIPPHSRPLKPDCRHAGLDIWATGGEAVRSSILAHGQVLQTPSMQVFPGLHCPFWAGTPLPPMTMCRPEPEPADPETLPEIAKTMENAMEEFIEAWTQLDGKTLAERRYERFRKF